MKKVIFILILLLLVIIVTGYGLLFTQPGNDLLKGTVESKLSEQLRMPVKVDKFSLRTSYLILKFKSPNSLKTDIKTDFSLFSKDVKGKILANVLDFSKFEKYAGRKLNGKCDITVDFKGNLKKNLLVDVSTNIFGGNTKAKITMYNKQLKKLVYKASNLKIELIVKFLNYNNYAKGVIDSFGEFDLANMKGNAKTMFLGNLIASTIKKDFQINLPYNRFKGEILNTLKNNKLIILSNIYSSLVDIKLDKTVFNLANKNFTSHYLFNIPDLALFNTIVNQRLRGKGKVDGVLNYQKSLFTKGNIFINKNKLDYTLTFPKLVVTSEKFNSIDILKTLTYPAIFKTDANIRLDYNLLSKTGKLKLTFKEGVLQNTKLFRTIKQFTGVDLTLEVYKNGFLTTDINDKILKNVFELKSSKTKISSDKTIINLDKSNIDSLINFEILGAPVKIFITGDLNKPDIKTDLGDLFKQQLIPQNINKNIKNLKREKKKHIKDIKKQFKNIKKNLFNNFK